MKNNPELAKTILHIAIGVNIGFLIFSEVSKIFVSIFLCMWILVRISLWKYEKDTKNKKNRSVNE